MRKLIRPIVTALYIACLAVANCVMPADSATAQEQAASPIVKQIALTKKQIEGVISAQKEMDEINEQVSEKPKPYLIVAEQFENAAKKNGFASYDEYTNVVQNISIVVAGFDPTAKKYIGSEALIKAQIAQVQSNKQMPPEDKTLALDELNAALKSPAPPVENKGNIDLVAAYYNKLAEAMGNDQQ
jgi:hypothetical protein